MKVTRQLVAEKLAAHLHGRLSQSELVDWAEHAMMDTEFEEKDIGLLADIVGRLGLADVAEFGLRWEDCEQFLRKLGYTARVDVVAAQVQTLLNESDWVLAGHCGFTAGELDFILNYAIKYRLGRVTEEEQRQASLPEVEGALPADRKRRR